MQKYSESKPPYILFIVKSASLDNIENDSMERIRGISSDYFKDGMLAPIPAIINDKTREIIEIPNFAI